MVTLFEFDDGAVRNEDIRPAELEVGADRLAEASGYRAVLERNNLHASRPLPLQQLRVKRLQVTGEGHFRARYP